MAFCYVNIGTSANDGSGDPLRTAFNKINDNFTYVIGLGGGGGGNVTANVDLTGYATLTYVNSGLANVTGVNLSALNNALANVNAVNLSALNNALANVNAVNLSALNNALANVYAVNLSNLNSALANVNAVSLNALNNALANLSLINLNNLNNALATVNFSLLSNVGNLVSAVTANTPSRVGIVTDLSTPGTTTGQAVLNNTDNGLYVWSGTAWTTASAAFTPNANSVAGVQVVSSLPVTSNFEGRQVLFNGALYIYSGGAFKSSTEVLTPTANSLTGIQIYTGASLPATSAADSGRTLFWTNNSNLYINVGGAWNNYNSYIQATSGNVSIGANSINSASLQNGIVTADKIASGAIIAGKISAGAIGATEIAANAITANKLAANSVTAGAMAAGTITADQIAANAITSSLIAANAIVAGKIAAGAISATEIAAGSIGADLIAANAIVTSKIAANAITAVQIAANAVYANAIQSNAITTDKLAANSITATQLAANSVYANAIQTNSITSNQIAANAITAVQLAANTVYAASLQARAITSDKIAANAITAVELAANSVYANALQANSVTAATIAANSITAVQLAANAVYANAIQANSIETSKIAANAITAVQIAANSIYANALQANSITTASLAANAITAKHIAANVITAAMIDSRGLTIRDSTGNLILGAGTGAQVVLSNTIVVADNTGTLRTLSNVVTQSNSSAIQFIGNYASNAAADAAYGGSAPVNSVYKNTTDNNSYVKETGGTWTLFLSSGTTGQSSYTAAIYIQSATAPAAPSGGSFNFSTNTLTPPTGWLTSPPTTTTTPTYAAHYTFYGTGTVSGGTYTTPYIIAETKSDGKSTVAVIVYLQQASAPATPTGGTYNFSTNTLTPPSGWSTTQPASSTTPTYISTNYFVTTNINATSVAPSVAWSTPRIGVVNGTNGATGAAGADGARGNQKIAQAISGSTWSDSQADSAITSLGLTKVNRDEVTLYNSSVGFSETRFWTGSAWSTISQYINGGLVVNGTISANQLAADSVTATKIAAGSITTAKMNAGSICGDRITAGTLSADRLTSGTSALASGSFALGTGSSLTIGGCSYSAQGVFSNSDPGKFSGLFDNCGLGFSLVAGNRRTGSWCYQGGAGAFGKSLNESYSGLWRSISVISDWETGVSSSINNTSNLPLASGYLAYNPVTGQNAAANCGTGLSLLHRGVYGFNQNATGALRSAGHLGNYSGSAGCTPIGSTGYTGGEFFTYRATGVSDWDTGAISGFHLDDNTRFAGKFITRYPGTATSASAADLAVYTGGVNQYAIAASKYTNLGVVCSQAFIGYTNIYSVYSTCGTVGPFTGSHDAYIDTNVILEPGDILIDIEPVAKKSVSDIITRVGLSSAPNQKSVVGVYVNTIGIGDANTAPIAIQTPKAYVAPSTKTDLIGVDAEGRPIYGETSYMDMPDHEPNIKTELYDFHMNHAYINMNSVGEGQVNVCGENGDIEVGDLITTSSMPGKGMKQADDIIRNYTVGKAREAVTFSSPTEVKQIAIIYHCG